MKVLFEAYWWFDGPPSGRNVLRSLVRAWVDKYPQDEVTLLLPRGLRRNALLKGLMDEYPSVKIHYSRAPVHALAAISAGAFTSNFDVVLSQNFSPMLVRARRCVFIHDVMYEEHPEWFTRAERLYLKGINWTARRADRILTSSKAEAFRITKRLTHLRAPVIPIGLSLNASYAGATSTPIKSPLIPSQFLLSVGRINVRKNLEALVRSLTHAEVIGEHRPLVIVGTPDGAQGHSQYLDAATSKRAVLWTGAVSDAELKWAYENCSAFIFPSLDEGFGLPVLEAMDAGARIALSDIPAFKEFGDVGAFFNPYDDVDIAEKVQSLIVNSPKLRSANLTANSWDSTVTKLRAVVKG